MNPSASSASPRVDERATKPLRQLKLVFWGPGASGKTTLLRYLSAILSPLVVSGRIEVATSEDHTLLSDYLAVQLPLRTLVILLHLMTTTGQRFEWWTPQQLRDQVTGHRASNRTTVRKEPFRTFILGATSFPCSRWSRMVHG
jgi:ABC-type polar amino acid transport system ATPase subunit